VRCHIFLLKEEYRTHENGTTRDVLEEPMRVDDSDPFSPEVLLVDIAGFDDCSYPMLRNCIHQSNAEIDLKRQDAAINAIKRADLILYLSSTGQSHLQHDSALRHYTGPIINIRSKVDTIAVENAIHPTEAHDPLIRRVDHICVSGMTGYHIDALRSMIADSLQNRLCSLSADTLTLLPRHEEALNNTMQYIADAQNLISPNQHCDWELIAAALRCALDSIGIITGEITPDEVLDEVFGKFCIGK